MNNTPHGYGFPFHYWVWESEWPSNVFSVYKYSLEETEMNGQKLFLQVPQMIAWT